MPRCGTAAGDVSPTRGKKTTPRKEKGSEEKLDASPLPVPDIEEKVWLSKLYDLNYISANLVFDSYRKIFYEGFLSINDMQVKNRIHVFYNKISLTKLLCLFLKNKVKHQLQKMILKVKVSIKKTWYY